MIWDQRYAAPHCIEGHLLTGCGAGVQVVARKD